MFHVFEKSRARITAVLVLVSLTPLLSVEKLLWKLLLLYPISKTYQSFLSILLFLPRQYPLLYNLWYHPKNDASPPLSSIPTNLFH